MISEVMMVYGGLIIWAAYIMNDVYGMIAGAVVIAYGLLARVAMWYSRKKGDEYCEKYPDVCI